MSTGLEDISLTVIGKDNIRVFRSLLSGLSLDDHGMSLGAIVNDEAVGVALFNKLGDALMLDYIFVAKAYRRQGVGRALIDKAFERMDGKEITALHVNYPEEASDLHLFFRSLHFILFRDGISWKVPVKSIIDSPSFRKLISQKQKHIVKPVSELTLKELKLLKKGMEAENYDPKILDDRRVDERLCLATIDKDNSSPKACILCEQEDKEIVIIFLINFSKDVYQIVDLFRAFKEIVEENDLLDCDILFVTMNEGSEALAKSITGGSGLSAKGKVISAIKEAVVIEETVFEDHDDMEIPGLSADRINYSVTAGRFALRSISKSQRTKRGIKFNDKARLQSEIYSAMLRYLELWNGSNVSAPDIPIFKNYKEDYDRTRGIRLFYSTINPKFKEEEYLNRDIDIYSHYHKGVKMDSDSIFECLEAENPGRFDYDSDEGFVHGEGEGSFEERFSTIRLLSHCERLIKDNKKFAHLKEKAKLMKDILSDYEFRAVLLQSPFYSLMAEKDFDELPDSDLKTRIKVTEYEPAKVYMERILERRKKNGFKKGVSADSLLKQEDSNG